MQIELSRDIAAPASRVWELITDLRGSPQVLDTVVSVEVLEGADPMQVGTRWRETRVMFGREATEEMVVSDLQPGRWYTAVATSHGSTYRSTFVVVPLGVSASRLITRFSATPTSGAAGVLAATLGRALRRTTVRALQADLDDIARAAEARAA